MISAVNGLPIDSHPLIVGRPAAHPSFSLFLIIPSSSKSDLGELGGEIVANTLAPPFAAHPGEIRAAERRFRCGERERVDSNHAGLQFRDRSAGAGRRARE